MDSTEIMAAMSAMNSKLQSSTHNMATEGIPIFMKSLIPSKLKDARVGSDHAYFRFAST